MFRKNKSKWFYWPAETEFIYKFISLMQEAVSDSEYDFDLVYKPSFHLPRKYWSINIPFPDGVSYWTERDIDAQSDKLLEHFKQSKSFKRARDVIVLFTECARGYVSTVEISYVICDNCDRKGNPGILVYWKR